MTKEEKEFRKLLTKKLDELYPKGKTRERGQALVFYAYAILFFQQVHEQGRIL